MVDEDSHSTDLSVSEEGHSTILLAHYIFWFQLRTQLFRNLVTPEQKCLEILLLLYNLHILASDFLFVTFVTKSNFLKKLRGTFWKISSNLWKALLITITKYRT